jgi:hypothetical protein
MHQHAANDVAAEGAPDDDATVEGGVAEPQTTADDKEQEEQAARLRERLRLCVARQHERSGRCRSSWLTCRSLFRHRRRMLEKKDELASKRRKVRRSS